MSEDKLTELNNMKKSPEDIESATLHICACGEKHLKQEGALSHLETCESPKKYGETCCCGSDHVSKGNHHDCGQSSKV